MFDIDASEFLVIAVVAIVAIGPKDLPRALRTAGRFIGKMRRISGHVRSGIESMIQEAELDETNRKWREQNAAASGETPEAQDAADVPIVPPKPGLEAAPAQVVQR
jgi:sec-independent protein translocase protein TatB